MPPPDPIAWYDAHAAEAGPGTRARPPQALGAWLGGLLPEPPAVVTDIGAGSGRDAAWLAGLGHEVIAVEPSSGMRREAAAAHGDDRIRWLDDRLPGLSGVVRGGLPADAVLVSAVWMHVPPEDRPRAFRRLVGVLRPRGVLAVTLRQGPPDPARAIHPVSLPEIESLAVANGLAVVRVHRQDDAPGRPGVSRTCVAMRLPDDGTGALPLLRHVVLHDDKSSTYKIALLRTLRRIADGRAGLARDTEDGHVAVPMGLVALTWLRLYLPLLAADLPQSVANRRAADRLGFAGPGLGALLGGHRVSQGPAGRRHARPECRSGGPRGHPRGGRHSLADACDVNHDILFISQRDETKQFSENSFLGRGKCQNPGLSGNSSSFFASTFASWSEKSASARRIFSGFRFISTSGTKAATRMRAVLTRAKSALTSDHRTRIRWIWVSSRSSL